jgi:hypothetical protein
MANGKLDVNLFEALGKDSYFDHLRPALNNIVEDVQTSNSKTRAGALECMYLQLFTVVLRILSHK